MEGLCFNGHILSVTNEFKMPLNLQLHGEGTSALRMFLATHLDTKQLSRSDVKKLLNEKENTLSTNELRLASSLLRELKASDPATPTLVSLLRQGRGVQARVMATDQEETEEDREKRAKYLARRRQKLLRLDEEMRYDSMVRNVKTQSAAKELAHHQTSVRQHLSIGANMVMARVTAFIAVYFLARNLTENETTRLVAGLGGAIVMMVIEMVLFIARAAKFESIEHEHKKHKSVF